MRSNAAGDGRLCFIPFQMPSLVEKPPEGDDWIHEIKYDGYRTQLLIQHGTARALTRNGHDWSRQYGPIAAAAAELPVKNAIVDGEVVVSRSARRSAGSRSAWCSSRSTFSTAMAPICGLSR
jgi:bifunctional non-homologous end joining protein LigD